MPKGKYLHKHKTGGEFKKGHKGHWAGKKRPGLHSEKNKKRMSDANKGSKNIFWKGGISTYKRKLFLNRRWQARRRNADGSHTLEEWENMKAQYDWICPACGKREPKIILTEDHVVPIVKGGSDNIENIQPLCARCNSKKHTNIKRYVKK